MAFVGRMTIPDHDGGRDSERLASALARIDAERRLYLCDGDRRVFRAAASLEALDELGLYAELGLAVGEIATRLHMSDWEVRRLILGTEDALVREAYRIIRPSW